MATIARGMVIRTLGIRTAGDIRMEVMSVMRLTGTVRMALAINANMSTAKSKVVCKSVGCTIQSTQVSFKSSDTYKV
jgi:hypothetical protein